MGAVTWRPTGLRLFFQLALTTAMMLWSGCSPQPLQPQPPGSLKTFRPPGAFKDAHAAAPGVSTGTIESTRADLSASGPSARVRSPQRSPDVYLGFRLTSATSGHIEATAMGFSFEQLHSIKASYAILRDETLKSSPQSPKIDLAFHPLDAISWEPQHDPNSAAWLIANRSVIIQLPKLTPAEEAVYRKIVHEWTQTVMVIAQNRKRLWPEFSFERVGCGRIDSIPPRKDLSGIVVAAPQASREWQVGELVEELRARTEVAAVVTRGFGPAECDGSRIHVSRPVETGESMDAMGHETARSREAYDRFAKTVDQLARGGLRHYLEFHQDPSIQHIDVATIGTNAAEARALKEAYYKIRDRTLKRTAAIAIDFLIEPNDRIEIDAKAEKTQGVLKHAKKAFHFALPAQTIFSDRATQRIYTGVLSDLISWIIERR